MHTVIRRRRGLALFELQELWAYRELVGFFAWRDIAVRYKQTVVGASWAVARPFLTMVVFTVVFGRIAKLPSDGLPYALLTMAALLPWQFFSTAFTDISASVVGSGHMLTKIYFPRLILPMTSSAVAATDFGVAMLFLAALMAYYGVAPPIQVIALPLFFVLCVVFSLGLGLWFAALHVKYRDVRHLIPFITQLGLFVSPVAFSSSTVPERWRFLYSLNPMVAVIDGFRWSLFGTVSLYVPGLIAGFTVSLVLFVTGVLYFKRTERDFADFI